MNLVEMFILNLVLLFFPILLYLFYLTFIKCFIKNENILFLDLSLLSSVVLVLKLSLATDFYLFTFIINIPLILAHINKRHLVAIAISLIILYSHGSSDLVLLTFLFLEYSMFLAFSKVKAKTFVKMFVIVKLFFSLIFIIIKGFNFYNLMFNILAIVFIYLFTLYSIYLFNKSKGINKMHLTLEEFEKDKQVRDSLFKISHEIKNPIAVCKSYLDMYDQNNKDHQKYIPIIKEEIDKVLYLLQDFLSINKIKIEPDIMDINMLLEVIVDQYEPVLKSNNIKFNYEIRQDEVYINGDYNRLNQVFTNIIKNSVEAMNKKDKFIRIYTKLNKNDFQIYFEDNGMGIDKEEIEKIKEPFYTTKKNGTGLGVTLSIEIIEAHNGTIYYNSLYGKGTQVIVTLPILID